MPTGTLHFTLDIDGERQLNAKLHGYLGRCLDLSPAFEDIARDWSESRVEVFAGAGAYDGLDGWPELSKRYARWKEKHYPGRLMLVRTGELIKAVVFPETEITAQSLTMTIDNDYAIYHHSSEPRESNLPRRQIASLGAAQKSRWVRILRKHIAGQD